MYDAIQFDLFAALPEIFVLTMAMFILLADLFIKPSSRFLIYVFAQFTLLGATLLTNLDRINLSGFERTED